MTTLCDKGQIVRRLSARLCYELSQKYRSVFNYRLVFENIYLQTNRLVYENIYLQRNRLVYENIYFQTNRLLYENIYLQTNRLV